VCQCRVKWISWWQEKVSSDNNINESPQRCLVPLLALYQYVKTSLTPWCATGMAGSSAVHPYLHDESSLHTALRNNYCSSSSSSQMVRAFKATPTLISSICGSLCLLLSTSKSFFVLRLFLSLPSLTVSTAYSSSTFPAFPLCLFHPEIQQSNLNPLHLSP